MINIPTDLLRTLVAVVDLRSFTKAAASLGITQPAVSSQIKRLLELLGNDPFDRSTQGVSLTPYGEFVVGNARRMLSINDQIMQLGGPNRISEQIIRVGAPGDFVASMLSHTLARFREQCPGVRFNVRVGTYEPLIRELRQGDLDLVVCLSAAPPVDARHYWPEEMVWVRGKTANVDLRQPVPLVSYGEKSLNRYIAVTALKNAGLECEDVFIGPSLLSLSGAVAAGLGVMVLARRRVEACGLIAWDDGPLPKLEKIYCGIYVREGGNRDTLEQLADQIADIMQPAPDSNMTASDDITPSLNVLRAKNSVA
jgi:DNA-binding transcriptional LysR family regulator